MAWPSTFVVEQQYSTPVASRDAGDISSNTALDGAGRTWWE
ncbi:hypothetical protein HMPREF1861_00778 [Corynebacterium kroppenstedtii]|nr:hypothetical protein HMPREF1861_00778 [Corynebacterium kroppenstedtii]